MFTFVLFDFASVSMWTGFIKISAFGIPVHVYFFSFVLYFSVWQDNRILGNFRIGIKEVAYG